MSVQKCASQLSKGLWMIHVQQYLDGVKPQINLIQLLIQHQLSQQENGLLLLKPENGYFTEESTKSTE